MRTGWIRNDSGIGMTELAVAIVLLGLMLAALAPLMVNSILLAQGNSLVGQANQIASSQLDIARNEVVGSACDPGESGSFTLGGESGTRFVAKRTVECNSEFTLATITIEVASAAEPGKVISSAKTQVVTTS